MALTETMPIDGHDYTFKQLRQWAVDFSIHQEGVLGATHLLTSAGAAMAVNVAAGEALVQMDSGAANNLYAQGNDAAINGIAVPASHASLPRIDQVVLQVRDPNVTGAFDTPQLYVLAGVATAGATLDNRAGATALPNDHLRLADILVPAASASVSAGNIRDRRPWARGAYVAALGPASNLTTTSSSPVQMTPNFSKRLECSGAPLEICFSGVVAHSAAIGQVLINPTVDAVNLGIASGMQAPAAGTYEGVAFQVPYTPAAGSHVIDMQWASPVAGTATAYTDASHLLAVIYRESIRPNASN